MDINERELYPENSQPLKRLLRDMAMLDIVHVGKFFFVCVWWGREFQIKFNKTHTHTTIWFCYIFFAFFVFYVYPRLIGLIFFHWSYDDDVDDSFSFFQILCCVCVCVLKHHLLTKYYGWLMSRWWW